MLGKVTIHAGTKYRVDGPDGTLSEKRTLDTDTEAWFISRVDGMRVYERDQDEGFLYVEPADEAPPPAI